MEANEIRNILERGEGILSLAPAWVPRPFNRPGKRIRLHPDDYYAMGLRRGAIVERWFSSITKVETEGAEEFEGMSFVNVDGNADHLVLFKEFVETLGAELIGEKLVQDYGTWPMYSKFYDYNEPLFHHVHHREEACAKVGVMPKHEHYFFPKQYNNHLGIRPVTYFGFDPSVTKEQVKERLSKFETADGRILELSRAFRMELGTGWFTPAGVVHAPGSVLTYEPQWNSDVNSVYENVTADEVNSITSLNENCPDDKKDDIDYIMSLMDWDANVDPHYRKKYFRPPVETDAPEGAIEKWVVYANPWVGAKELTVLPGQTVTIKDAAAYGCITVQGHGTFGPHDCEAAIMLRYGQMSADEFFVSEKAAKEGVVISNHSKVEPLVILKHFAPNNKEIPQKSPLWED